MEKEKIAAAVVRFNRRISESVAELERAIRDVEAFREPFAEQRNLLARVELVKRIFTAAINHAEQLRPKMYLIEDSPEEKAPTKSAKEKRSYKTKK